MTVIISLATPAEQDALIDLKWQINKAEYRAAI
jgi:hypothetical protein